MAINAYYIIIFPVFNMKIPLKHFYVNNLGIKFVKYVQDD